jgi:hypothetical protein
LVAKTRSEYETSGTTIRTGMLVGGDGIAKWRLSNTNHYSPDFSYTCARRATNHPRFDIKRPWMQSVFSLVALLYGGLHCLAWNSEFPSSTQQRLWRCSASIVTGAGLPILICNLLLEKTYYNCNGEIGIISARWRIMVFTALKPFLKERLACILGDSRDIYLDCLSGGSTTTRQDVWPDMPKLYNTIEYTLKGALIVLLPVYVFARIYLVVESLIQMFHLEPGPVFAQPNWPTYFPHLG